MSNFPFEAHENVSNYRSGIYAIVNLANNKLYIGSAVKLSTRQSQHLSDLNFGKHKNRHLQSSFNKYGKDYFVFKVVEYCETKDLIEREQFWINQFDFDTQLYNLNPIAGSRLGTKWSDETRKKWMNAIERRNKNSGIKKGFIFSETARKKMSESAKNMPKERRNKISGANGKKVHQIDKVTGEILATFNSIKEAENKMNGLSYNISSVCVGRRKLAYGYRWQYVTNQD